MSDTSETTFDALPESLVSSVLDRWGYTPPAETPAEPADEATAPEPEPEEETVPDATPTPPGGPIFEPEEDGEDEDEEEPDETVAADDTADGAPAPQAAPQTDPLTSLLSEKLADPNVRDQLLRLLLGQTASPQPAPAQQPENQLPAISEEDLENPAVRASLLILNQQREQIAELQKQFADNQRVVEERNQAELIRVAETAVNAFQATHNLPDELVHKIRVAAGPMTNAAAATVGTGDPYTIMSKALEMAYWTVPEARRFEFERQSEARTKARTRRQKLGGIGGNSGSAQRNPPAPDTSTAEGRFDAAVAEAAAAMYGSETEP